MKNLEREITFNQHTEILTYSFDMDGEIAYSCFKVNLNIIKDVIKDMKLLKSLELREKILISNDLFSEIQEKWFLSNNYEYKKVWFPINADKKFVKIFMEAYKAKCSVMAIYSEGYECYPSEEDEDNGAVCSEDGLTHVYRVGVTNGKRVSALALETGNSMGGSIFMFAGLVDLKIIKQQYYS